MASLFLIGDIHGQYDNLVSLLRESGLIKSDLSWIAGRSALWFLGDLVDRGPNSLGVIDLVMRLGREAKATGGTVGCLMGNHEVVLLSAYRFGERRTTGPAGTFLGDWLTNGGNIKDMTGLRQDQVAWLTALPAMALVEGRLLVHADTVMYYEYGRSLETVNQAFAGMMRDGDPDTLDRLLFNFSHRDDFLHSEGIAAAQVFLAAYGGKQIVHGHSPILRITRQRPEAVTEPLFYANGLCVNLDAGMYMGGPGFIYECH